MSIHEALSSLSIECVSFSIYDSHITHLNTAMYGAFVCVK